MRKNFSIIDKLNLKYFCTKKVNAILSQFVWRSKLYVCVFWNIFIFSVSTCKFSPVQKCHFLDYALIDRRPHTSLGFDLDKAPGLTSPTRGLEQPELGGTAYVSCGVQRLSPPYMWQLGYGLTHLLNHMCVYVEFFSS